MGNKINDDSINDSDSTPTDGVMSGNTLTVWPHTDHPPPEDIFNQITSTGFDPVTGNGWLPAVDGMQVTVPQQARVETQTALTKIKQCFASPQGNSLMSADFWAFKPAIAEPSRWNSEDPIITIVPASFITDAPLPAGSSSSKVVGVNIRILDEVHDGKQHLAVVGTKKSVSPIPLIPVKATKYGGSTAFYCGMMPGVYNFLEFYLARPESKAPEQKLFWKASVESGPLRPAGATVGQSTNDFIAYFPPESNLAPVYVAITCLITASQVQQRQNAENKAAAAKAEAEAKAKAAAEAKAKAEAAAKAKAAAEAKAKAEAAEKAKASLEAAMPASNAIILASLPGTLEFTIGNYGTWVGSSAAGQTIARELAIGGRYYISNLSRTASLISRLESVLAEGATALLSTASLSAAVVIAGLWPFQAGKGSDKVPLLLSIPLNTLTGTQNHLQPRTSTVDLPVRASLTEEHNHPVLKLVKTGDGGLPKTVPVLNIEHDEKTGLDRIMVPAGNGSPPRTILINPVPVNTPSPPHTGNNRDDFILQPHPPGEISPIPGMPITTTPLPESERPQDFIYWRPDASGTGVEPVYVVLSDPLDSGRFTRKQLDKKFKHASDFGIDSSKKNRETLIQFRDAIEAHLADKDTVKKGTYRREKGSTVYFNPKTNNVVILKPNGTWISGWKIDPKEKAGKIYLETGVL